MLFTFYPLLLEIAFLPGHTPSMWMFPDEHARLYAPHDRESHATPAVHDSSTGKEEHDGLSPVADPKHPNGDVDGGPDKSDRVFDAGDGADLIEVTARDLARRCLELVGEEIGLGVESR